MKTFKGIILSALCIALLVGFSQANEDSAPEPTEPADVCETKENQDAFHKCFDPLKQDMMSPPKPNDINEFMCEDPHKERLNCVIQAFKKCPKYAEAPDVKQFKDIKSGLTVNDLLYVTSGDEFCKCSPTNGCLMKIETEKLGSDLAKSPWNKLANMEYICGIGRKHIECVANSLPSCERYLQYQYNKTMMASMMPYYDVSGLDYASVFADAHCKNWPNDKIDSSCPEKRAEWKSVKKCYGYALNYRLEEDLQCGLRKCIEIAMVSCPRGSMEFFIDSVNVFGEYKITRGPCTVTSSSSTLLATLTSLLLAVYVSMFL